MLPDFIIIGAPRCATTFLAQNLNDHPDVYIAQGEEEYAAGDVHFFDVSTEDGKRNFSKGIDWYSKLFEEVKGEKRVGEKTADYLADIDSAKLIKEYLGKTQLIVMLRDPVIRAWSHFHHSRHRLPFRQSFDELIESGDSSGLQILSTGMYARLLKPFIDTQGKENVLVILQEDFQEEPAKTMKILCEFLDVPSDISFPKLYSKINQSSSSFVSYLVARVGRKLRLNFPRFHYFLITGPIDELLKSIILRLRGKHKKASPSNIKSEVMSENAEKNLRNLYRDDVIELEEIINRPLRKIWWKE